MTLRAWISHWSAISTRSQLGLTAVALVLLAGAGAWVVGLEAWLRARLDPAGSTAPTRLYARPFVVQPGTVGDRSRLERHLQRLGYREARGRSVAIGEYRLGSWRWTIGRRAFRLAEGLEPGGVAHVELDWADRVAQLTDAEGRELPFVTLEPEVLRTVHGADGADRTPLRLDEVPQHLIDAILTAEDRHFFEHEGLDLRRIVGAAVANLKSRRLAQGGSTITQQLARTLWLSTRRTPWRKLREMAMARVLERRHAKSDILTAYLNEVYLGQDGALAIRGVGRAAEFYFDEDVTALGLSEAALLAGIIRGPNLYSPFRHPKAARARRDLVLDLMLARGLVSERDHRSAQRARIRLRANPESRRVGPHFTDHVVRALEERQGRKRLARGLAVFTTLDPDLQRLGEDAVREGLRRLERSHATLGRADAPLQAALVALDPRTGEVLALVGGRDYARSQFNRVTMAHRQPGSAFKPVVALAALAPAQREQHSARPPFTLASLLDDEPLSLETPAGLWRPANYDGRFRGRVTLRQALERSLNVPFARLGLAVGPDRIAEVGRVLGVESPLKPFPSLALGASEVTPLELTRAFAVLAAAGYRADVITTLGVLDASGEVLERAELHGEQVVSPAVAYLVTSALQGAVEQGTGQGLRSMGYDGPVAAKSGTTNDHKDAWFVGYTPTLAVGVWVGFDDGRSLGLPGAAAALPIFARFLTGAVGERDATDFPVPDGVEFVAVDPATGLRAGWGCWGEREVFLEGTAPEGSCGPSVVWGRALEDVWSGIYNEGVRPLVDELRRRLGVGR